MKKGSFLYKLISCIVAGLVTAALWLLMGNGESNPVFPKPIIFSFVAISLGGAVIVPFIWQYLQKKGAEIANRMYGWLYVVIRGAIAFDLAIFGSKKVFHMQFIVPENTTTLPLKDIDSETLTWYYFGHSFTFTCILAFIQLAGAAMLLFRKTCLLGAIILFALLVNIASIDYFYQLNLGALAQAVIMTMGTAFLILTDYDRLVVFFLKAQSNMRSVNIKMGIKHMLRMGMVLLIVLYEWYVITR